MQFLARLMDHALEARGERTTIVVATSGDTGGAAVEAFRGRNRMRSGRAVSERPRLRRAAADDDDGRRRQRPCARHRRHFRRLPGAGERHVQPSCLSRPRALSGVNSINWARIVAQTVYYFTAAVALGAPHRTVAFTVPTGNFGDIFAGYVAQAHGAADRPAGDRDQRQRHPGAHARRPAAMRCATCVPTTSPSMDIQVSSNFERLLFEAYGRDAASVRRLMDSLAQSRPLRYRADARLPRSARDFDADRADEDGGRRDHPHRAARDRRISSIRIPRWRSRSPKRRPRDPAIPMVVLVDRACREISRCGGGGLRRAAAIAGLACRSDEPGRAHHRCCRPIRVEVERFVLAASRAAREGAAA